MNNNIEDFKKITIFKSKSEIIHYLKVYFSQDDNRFYIGKCLDDLPRNIINPFISDFEVDEAYDNVNNFKCDPDLDGFTTEYDGVLGCLQIAYFEEHPTLNVNEFNSALITLDDMPHDQKLKHATVLLRSPEELITMVNRWRLRKFLSQLITEYNLSDTTKLTKELILTLLQLMELMNKLRTLI